MSTPDYSPYYIKEILNPSNCGISINKLCVPFDGSSMWAVVRRGDRNGLGRGGAQSMLYKSTFSGLMWDETQYANLAKIQSTVDNGTLVWEIALAQDDSKLIAVVCSDIGIDPLAQELWISTDAGTTWKKLVWLSEGSGTHGRFVSSLCVSRRMDDFCRYIMIGIRDGGGSSVDNLHIVKIQHEKATGYVSESKTIRISDDSIPGDVLCAKFSPLFAGDRTVVATYTSDLKGHEGTWLAVGAFDIRNETHVWQPVSKHLEVRRSSSPKGSSPRIDEIIAAEFELPSDFAWDDARRRRIFVFTRAENSKTNRSMDTGLFRILDGIISNIFDNNASEMPLSADGSHDKHIASISYFGTSESGQLLVGNSLGESSTAQVPTWFSNTPFARRLSWDRAMKAPTGAGIADVETKSGLMEGFGNAHVQWSHAGDLAFAATGAATLGPWATPKIDRYNSVQVSANWPAGAFNVLPNDESALSLSRNNGQTWNQISLINTMMAKLTDVAPALDSTSIYLASVSNLDGTGFASIWRTTVNPNVAAPLPAIPPLGTLWERVLVHQPHLKLSEGETSYPIIRVAKDIRDGANVSVSVQGASSLLWSPDYGDFWQMAPVGVPVQDFAYGSSTKIYMLGRNGFVEGMAFTGIEWRSVRSINTNLGSAHNIATAYEQYVLVGASSEARLHSVAYSSDRGGTWLLGTDQMPGHGNIHVLFDEDFSNNKFFYAACDSADGSIYRNTFPFYTSWLSCDMLRSMSRDSGPPVGGNSLNASEKYGMVAAITGIPAPALYVACCNAQTAQNGVFRTLEGRTGLPSPGLSWDRLHLFTPGWPDGAKFSLEPSSMKISGCSTLDTNSTLYAIDNNLYASNHNVRNGLGNMRVSGESGMLWTYTDCLAKKGPVLSMKDNAVIECEPLTYVNKAIFFTWEQLCISTEYQLQIARDVDFGLVVTNIPSLSPASYSSPALAYFLGGKITSPETITVPGLEFDVTYYWRCRAISSANGTNLKSPWSEIRKFSIRIKSDSPISSSAARSIASVHEYDFFVSYATEDASFVDKLARFLSDYYRVWFAEFAITAGDSITQKVNEGLAKSQYGIVVLSPHFFTKDFPQRELGALFALMAQNRQKTIIPIWHEIGRAEILRIAPMMADIKAIDSSLSLDRILVEIRRATTPQ